MLYRTMTVLLEYIVLFTYNFPQMLNTAINIYFTLPYYAGIMLNAFNDPLCLKLCWHNRWVPRNKAYIHRFLQVTHVLNSVLVNI